MWVLGKEKDLKILVDELPKKGEECLFRAYHNENCNHWTCWFRNTTVCSLDCGEKCEYLEEKKCKS